MLAPAEPHLGGARHLLLVLDGPLHSFPFQVLVRRLPQEQPPDYPEADWLARHYALTQLPAVYARGLRGCLAGVEHRRS